MRVFYYFHYFIKELYISLYSFIIFVFFYYLPTKRTKAPHTRKGNEEEEKPRAVCATRLMFPKRRMFPKRGKKKKANVSYAQKKNVS